MGENIVVAGHQVILDGRRALYWSEQRLLAIADLHLGKAEAFQRRGMPVPSGSHNSDLDRLRDLVRDHQPAEILVLGDFVHEKHSWTPAVEESVARFLEDTGVKIRVIRGNHDRGLVLPAIPGLEMIEDELRLNDICFRHEPAKGDGYTICGHIHPVAKIAHGGDALRLPVFWVLPKRLILPAFTEFAGGWLVEPSSKDRLYAVVDHHVFTLPRPRSGLF